MRLTFTLMHIADLLAHVDVETRRGDITLWYDEQLLGSLSATAEHGSIEVGGRDVGREFFQSRGGATTVLLRAWRGRIHRWKVDSMLTIR
ncbi:MAG: hypothetical protein M3418_04165 [Gemmatimonadota bacterium]|nr:hypothetical protein [Gemmatimonadota bacterium]